MMNHSKFNLGAAVCMLAATSLMQSVPAQADDTGAFIGGVFAARLVDNMRRRTEAEEIQAANSSRQQTTVVQTVPKAATPAAMTPEQQLQQLDKLAAGGYITPDEYKARRQAILNSM